MAENVTERRCCLKTCSKSLDETEARAEVKSFAAEPSSSLCVNWGPCGEAAFHYQCWKRLLKACKHVDAGVPITPPEREMVDEARKTVEMHTSEVELDREARRIADFLKSARSAIAFTGAGISTAAGIGDFRGKSGKWTENDRQKSYGNKAKKDTSGRFSYSDLRPTYTHEALAKLVELGIIKHVISQNCDGLHELSGIPRGRLWELHGNVFHEKCEKCETRYSRKSCVSSGGGLNLPQGVWKACPSCRLCHRTGRLCEKQGCGGFLMNTVINFGDSLEEQVLDGAMQCARQNDLVLCLGTSLRVSPANVLVEMGSTPTVRLVICNRQTTPCDELCYMTVGTQQAGSRVYGDCDRLMRKVMAYLLPAEDLTQWEDGRRGRMQTYSQQRI